MVVNTAQFLVSASIVIVHPNDILMAFLSILSSWGGGERDFSRGSVSGKYILTVFGCQLSEQPPAITNYM